MTSYAWDDEQRRKKEMEAVNGGAQTGAPAASTPTFSELQRNGRPRPAPTGGGYPGTAGPASPAPAAPPPMRPLLAPRSWGRPNRVAGPTASMTPAAPGSTITTTAADPNAMTPFGQSLLDRYQNYQGPAGFRSQTTTQRAPTYTPGAGPMGAGPQFQQAMVPQGQARSVGRFQPGASPISAPGQATAVPGAFQPGQYDARYDAVDAPLMRETGAFTPGQQPFNPQLQQLVGSMLGNPSAYGQDAVMSTFNRMSGQIDDDFAQQQTALEEDMARRGLADSSIRGGRLQDLNVGKRSARVELADRLTEKMAETQSADTARAIAQAMGLGSQSFNQGLAGFQANMGANAQNFQQDLATRAFQGDQQAMEVLRNMDVAGFNRASGQMGFENEMGRAGMQDQFTGNQFGREVQAGAFNQGLAQDAFSNEIAGAQANEGLDASAQQRLLAALGYNRASQQMGFENDLSVGGFNRQLGLDDFATGMQSAQFGANEDQRGIDNLESEYGLNLGADQQGFNQRQALLDDLLGYQQQGFTNRMAVDTFNADNAFRDKALSTNAYLQTLGIGQPGEGTAAPQEAAAAEQAKQRMVEAYALYGIGSREAKAAQEAWRQAREAQLAAERNVYQGGR